MDAIRHLVILGHPAERSFNHGIAACYCRSVGECGQEAELRDLYAMGFDPLLKDRERPGRPGFAPAPDVQAELELLRGASVVTLVYPIWFGMPPAIIKGYVDRVLGAGVAPSDLKAGTSQSVLRDKHLRLITTSASTRPWLEQQGQWLALRQAFDTYLATAFAVRSHDHLHFDAVVEGTGERYLAECCSATHEKARDWCARVLREHRRPAPARASG